MGLSNYSYISQNRRAGLNVFDFVSTTFWKNIQSSGHRERSIVLQVNVGWWDFKDELDLESVNTSPVGSKIKLRKACDTWQRHASSGNPVEVGGSSEHPEGLSEDIG